MFDFLNYFPYLPEALDLAFEAFKSIFSTEVGILSSPGPKILDYLISNYSG